MWPHHLVRECGSTRIWAGVPAGGPVFGASEHPRAERKAQRARAAWPECTTLGRTAGAVAITSAALLLLVLLTSVGGLIA